MESLECRITFPEGVWKRGPKQEVVCTSQTMIERKEHMACSSSELNICVPHPNSYVKSVIPDVLMFGGGALGHDVVM